MVGPGLYTDIGKKARGIAIPPFTLSDICMYVCVYMCMYKFGYLLYKDYQSDKKFTITTFSPTGVAITTSGTNKGELFLGDVNTQLKNKNVTTDIKVDTDSNLSTTITVDQPAPGLKAIFCFKVPDQRSGKVGLLYVVKLMGRCGSLCVVKHFINRDQL
ncbi:hypothetical protein C1H46_044704 [Malus baccata]|uniref:Uncharacterized protein n=1 Tax=Malus baccata TaxID=106549 RepID=A0A540K6A7_MALBA|nr:hypothetical protein C1H46_044704 [Malus baccata]